MRRVRDERVERISNLLSSKRHQESLIVDDEVLCIKVQHWIVRSVFVVSRKNLSSVQQKFINEKKHNKDKGKNYHIWKYCSHWLHSRKPSVPCPLKVQNVIISVTIHSQRYGQTQLKVDEFVVPDI